MGSTPLTPAQTVLKEASDCFKNARRSVFEGVELLFCIQKETLYDGAYTSFWEYVEQECQLSRGQASKLLQSYEFYVLKGGVSHAKLTDIDPEKLYLALKLPTGTVEQRLVKAREWNRRDLQDALSEDENGGQCTHPADKHVTICGVCQRRVD